MGRGPQLGCPQYSHMEVLASSSGSPLIALGPSIASHHSSGLPTIFLQIRETQGGCLFQSAERA